LTLVGLGLSFKNSGLDRKIWQSAHLCCVQPPSDRRLAALL